MEEIFNLKLGKDDVRKLRLVSNFYEVAEKRWLERNVSNLLQYEFLKVRDMANDQYLKGLIREKQYVEFTGYTPIAALRKKRKKLLSTRRKPMIPNYLEDLAQKIKFGSHSNNYDEHMTEVIKKIDTARLSSAKG